MLIFSMENKDARPGQMTQQNLVVIQNDADPDIHAVVEKLAYRLYLKDANQGEKANWLEAQNRLCSYCRGGKYHKERVLPGDLKRDLNKIQAERYKGEQNSRELAIEHIAMCVLEPKALH